ncbi:Oidioi.mRNA.OKI2018_I69.chr1.g1047.t1.cds [Oikopleura dioica]|uniref:Oidioi.mRNA.OKI2018_I69.chr1.g1047.t1.cds n=1 Tax=Oikopleura dioica TaxID=34765 RepID=A0ABN7SLQ7_OIKDI|nr:Oidioi.mRNA.OKI2018_I69.chr1.g1047.t1.cds [Oikopleura dioica]
MSKFSSYSLKEIQEEYEKYLEELANKTESTESKSMTLITTTTNGIGGTVDFGSGDQSLPLSTSPPATSAVAVRSISANKQTRLMDYSHHSFQRSFAHPRNHPIIIEHFPSNTEQPPVTI